MSAAGGRRDRGVADALGLVLIAPAIVGFALLSIWLGRSVDAAAQVRSAAEAAAQAAALERDPRAARTAAERVVAETLGSGSTCTSPEVVVDYPAERPVGEVATVTVVVDCEVSDDGVELVGRPRRERVTAVATLDAFRARP